MKFFVELGQYLQLQKQVFRKPEKGKVFRKQMLLEMYNMATSSIGIVSIISVFMGAVTAIQTAFNIDSPLIPLYTIGFTVRSSMIMEFSPTIISLILAGKVGSSIASEIGTMRVTEQIDAMEIMGLNSASYLILPKVLAAIFVNPILVVISMAISIFGGWCASVGLDLVSSANYMWGAQISFKMYDVFYALTKTVAFAFLIATISGFQGYRIKGGAVEVGRASTKAVVISSVYIIIFNLIITQILLG